jgi:hypothetical protein
MMVIERYTRALAGEVGIRQAPDRDGDDHRKAWRTVPAAFTTSEAFDVGADLGSPVSLDDCDRRPFFDGKIESVSVSRQ